ncbi:MAG TPA: acyltransferase [Chitinophagaceae bacterium]|nr:acyltransferase [Chitinophagaceae bacterium]
MNKAHQKGYLTPASSFLLDATRLIAALTVAFTHARAIWFRDKEYDYVTSHLSHGSVIVFFVLSGYVIAYTTGTKNRTLSEYAAARLSRLYSGMVPALVFTLLVLVILLFQQPALLNRYAQDHTVWRYIISFFFCNEIWFLSAAPLLNGVIWSLSFEFWFYVIFGCWLYRNNHKNGFLLLIIAMVIAGPKIILMLFVWILGVLAYNLPKPRLKPPDRRIYIMLSLFTAVVLMLVLPQIPYPVNTSKLYWASPFISDFIAALFIAFAFWLLELSPRPALINNKIKFFRKIADLTFPIYILHYPCLVLIKSFITGSSLVTMYLALVLTLAFCFFVGLYIEKLHVSGKTVFKRLFRWIPLKSAFYKPIHIAKTNG